jgi:acetolactate synthase-1/2/3 large subunit
MDTGVVTLPTEADDAASSGADVLLRVLRAHGVEVVFGYPGGAVLPIYDALFKQDAIRHILARHEQAAVHAAEGYARSTGRTGVVLVTSGPGATNAVTGLVDALMDSIPVVCLTGQVPTHLIGNDAFQEADTTGITRPATKHNYLVKDTNDLARVLHEAFHIAATGRPGPVVVDLPKNIMIADAPYAPPSSAPHRSYRPVREPDPSSIAQAVTMLRCARRPVFYTGGGVINAGPEASVTLRRLIDATGYPCTSTLMGLGALPASHASFLGMLGMHGTVQANLAMHGADLIVCVGARFDDRVTGRLDAFAPHARKIHIDIDPSSINKNVRVDLPVIGDAGRALSLLLDGWNNSDVPVDRAAIEGWWRTIDAWRATDCLAYTQDEAPDAIIKPQHALARLQALTKASGRDTYISTEVGQHQMWAAQYLDFEHPNRWMTSGGLGTMGYGLPAAIGTQVAHPDALVIDVAGEASILMNIQELGTMAQYRLPVKIFILNNRYMGMVRQWQELLHGSRYSESYSEALPDFVQLASAFHARGLRATCLGELDATIQAMIDHPGPVVCEIVVDEHENCFPMIPSGAAHNEMILGPEGESRARGITDEGMMLV